MHKITHTVEINSTIMVKGSPGADIQTVQRYAMDEHNEFIRAEVEPNEETLISEPVDIFTGTPIWHDDLHGWLVSIRTVYRTAIVSPGL
jgi:hypothetical protein